MITARALGVLMEIASKELYGGATALSEAFKEGRDACQKAINELKGLGLLSTTTQKYSNGAYRRVIAVTEEGWELLETRMARLLETRAISKLSEPNSRLSTNSILANKQERVRDGVAEEEFYKVDLTTGGKMTFPGQMDFDADDHMEQLRKDRERRTREHQDLKQKKFLDAVEFKNGRSPVDWTPDQSSTAFIERVEGTWGIRPWTMSKRGFRAAFATARKNHGTDGEIELLMMDRYFNQLAHEKGIDNPEHLWKRFILQFGSLAVEAKRSMVTDEDLETAKVEASKSWEGI